MCSHDCIHLCHNAIFLEVLATPPFCSGVVGKEPMEN